ncbi:hypothetical protein DIURU_004084 [Diutina rugosa]|uniref:Rhodanese domain-containing protein n=1 Tax=Diutina rugosa TaxID=5481 RepID=A0A642UMX4_DIURU|nr:uncharacterized protein DIURU_004084 [Diutina rugosa]KAA8899827.1 hypothetical protein DIURU_004084 [Diutina rugosa]
MFRAGRGLAGMVPRTRAVVAMTTMASRVVATAPRMVASRMMASPAAAPVQWRRGYSVISASPEAEVYHYDQVKRLATHPDPHTVLVDVREPVEYEEGHIPGAVNLPFKSSPGALGLSPDDFLDAFGFNKPDANDLLVFYCLGGVRSTAAEELADTFGYKHRANYVGSWEDWVAHENQSSSA